MSTSAGASGARGSTRRGSGGDATRDSLVFSSRELHRQPGSSERLSRRIRVEESWSNAVSSAAPDEWVDADVLLESVHDGILAAVSATVPVVATCVRCLTPMSWTEQITVQQFFAYPESGPVTDAEGDADVAVLEGDLLDVAPAFRDEVVLALPLTPRCSDDCPGLCSECGFMLAQDPDHRHERTDPRWSALADFRVDDHQTKESD